MTAAEIRAAVDTRLANLWATIQTRQETYAGAHNGRYWQGLRTHSITPTDGVTALPDVGTACPTDQLGQPWPLSIRQTQMEMALRMDVYDGPAGVGYQATVFVTIVGQTWMRSAQVGPETWRTHGWQRADAEEGEA